jgi:hypothetical protein
MIKNFFTTAFILLCVIPNASFSQKTTEATCPSWGPYVEAQNLGTKNGLLLMCDIMADESCITYHTYWSTINFNIGPRGGYCGIQRKTDDGGVYNNIFSIWDLKDSKKPQCFAEYKIAGEFVSGFGGEGTGLHSHNNMPWVPGQKYCTAIRRWYTKAGQTRVGFFMYDYTNATWTHYITAVTPEDNAFFINPSFGGFLEKFSGDPLQRCGYWSNWWKLNEDETWNKATSIKCQAGKGTWKAEKINDSTVKMYSCGSYAAPDSIYHFNVNIPGDKPSVAVAAEILKATASYKNAGKQITISWVINKSKAPQLGYNIEVYDNKNCSGKFLYNKTNIVPQTREEHIATQGLQKGKKYYVAIQVKDIFDQSSNKIICSFDF